jgi:hypothetical protein
MDVSYFLDLQEVKCEARLTTFTGSELLGELRSHVCFRTMAVYTNAGVC